VPERPPPSSPSRREYALAQRAEYGRRAVAVLPVHFPKPLLTALDLLSIELWGPPGPPRGDGAGRLQPYVCALVRNALAFLAAGRADVVSAVLVPHTCDSLQGLATLLPDFGGFSGPTLVFQHPRDTARRSARTYLRGELGALGAALERVAGRRLEDARLAEAIALHDEIDALRRELLGARARLPGSDAQLYAVLRRGEWLWPNEFLLELRALRESLRPEPVQSGLPLLVTGYVPEPSGLLEILNQAGAYVGADDYAAVGRRISSPVPPSGDPWADLVARTLAAPPCPTRGVDQKARLAYLTALAARANVRGVLVHVQKFCEPELFDVPAIRAAFAAQGLPVLVLEGELEREVSGQTVTRLEAFVELLQAGRAA
jgi:benzoyl-CoA reductase/2-hydroxyglutaryl-CoA dehydratase subunit BcrC/BadD/HgdB